MKMHHFIIAILFILASLSTENLTFGVCVKKIVLFHNSEIQSSPWWYQAKKQTNNYKNNL